MPLSTSPQRRSYRFRRLCRTALGVLLGLASWNLPTSHGAVPLPEVLSQTPSGSQIVLLVPSLSDLETKVAEFNQHMGLNIPELNHLLTIVRSGTGLTEGLDEKGPAMIVVPNVMLLAATFTSTQAKRPILFFVPVKDYGVMARSLGADTSGRVTAFQHPQGPDGFIRQHEGFALLSPMKGALDAYAPTGHTKALAAKLGPAASQTFAAADIALYVDIQGIAPALLPLLNLASQQLANQVDPLAATPQQQALIDQSIERSLQACHTVIAGARALVLALDLSEAGLGWTSCLSMVPDSKLASHFSQDLPLPTDQLLGSLPDRSFLLAGAANTQGLGLGTLITNLLADLPTTSEADPTVALLHDTFKLWEQTQGIATAFYAPDVENILTGGLLNTLTLYHTDDPQTLRASIRSAFERMAELPITPDASSIPFRVASLYQPNALTIAGVPIDQFDLQIDQTRSETAEPLLPLMMMLGGSGSRGMIATTDNAVLLSTVSDEALMTAGLEAARHPQAAGLGRTTDFSTLRTHHLPAGLLFEGYLSLAGVMETANTFLPLFGMAALSSDEPLLPLACGLGLDAHTLSFRTFFPTSTLRAGADAVGQFIPRSSTLQP